MMAMMVAILIPIEAVVWCAFLIPAIRELIINFQNPFPTFNEQQEERFHTVIENYRKKGIDPKTRTIQRGRS